MIDKKTVIKELDKVLDPEIGIPITAMKLIDKINIDKDKVTVEFHLTMPWCPGVFATEIAKNIKKVVSEIEGVKSVQVKLKDHYMDEQINKEVNR
jgi:metal-sulfur cluster biosynthetic enzyme